MVRFIDTRLLAFSVVVLGVLDGVLTQLDWDPLHEVNPLMSALRDSNLFFPIKVGATILAVLVLLFLATKYPQKIYRILVGLTVFMLCVCLLNAAALA